MTWDLAIDGEPPPPSTESRFIAASAAHMPPSPEWCGRVCRSAWSTKITQLAAPVRVLLHYYRCTLQSNVWGRQCGMGVGDGVVLCGVGDSVEWESRCGVGVGDGV